MNLFDEPEEREFVNVLDFLTHWGIDREQAFHIVLHILLTQSYADPADVRAAAADFGTPIPYVHPGDGRMH
jgi:hypothetical protein